MTRALITTTINNPTVLRRYAASMDRDDDVIIVVGDRKSPHGTIQTTLDELHMEHAYYLHPDDQAKWASSEAIGWNCIQRRNIAILEAMAFEPETITTVDDDNIPQSDYFEQVDAAFRAERALVYSNTDGWYNVGRHLRPSVVHRGYPYSRRHVSYSGDDASLQDVKVGVVAGLWLGDPDIDAAERMVNRPICYATSDTVKEQGGFALAPGTWCPFNSQNTSWLTELAPLMYCWPHVGRFDDIWASYLARRVMDHLGFNCWYGNPVVTQERNEHNLVSDLRQEIFGYEMTDAVVEALQDLTLPKTTEVLELLDACLWAVGELMPNDTRRSFATWMDDCAKVVAS